MNVDINLRFLTFIFLFKKFVKLGFIGDFGSLSRRHYINIATAHFERCEAGGKVIALVEIDGGLANFVLSEIRPLEYVFCTHAFLVERLTN